LRISKLLWVDGSIPDAAADNDYRPALRMALSGHKRFDDKTI